MLVVGVGGGREKTVKTHFHLAAKFEMSGTLPSSSLFVFMVYRTDKEGILDQPVTNAPRPCSTFL
jgi:hypothetical protein